MSFCPSCGAQNADGAVFCANCGVSFTHPPQTPPMAASPQVDFAAMANKAQALNNKFLSFLKPFLNTIDDGSFFRKVFSILYLIIAILNIILPVYVLVKMIDSGLFKADGKFILVGLITWLILAFLCWFGFQLWWDRRTRVNQSAYAGAEFDWFTLVLLSHHN